MNHDELIALLHALRDGDAPDELAAHLGVEPGPDAAETWAPVSLAQVLCALPERTDITPEADALTRAPLGVRLVFAAAAHHDTSNVYLGNFDLRALSLGVHPSHELARAHYEGLAEWGGHAGARARRLAHGGLLGFGNLHALVSWTGSTRAAVTVYTDPLAGVADHEREAYPFPSLGGFVLELLDQNTFEFTPGELGTMHPTHVTRGRHDSLRDVFDTLSATLDSQGWY